MQFSLFRQSVLLQGLQGGTIHYASKNQLTKLTGHTSKEVCALLWIEIPFLHIMKGTDQQNRDHIADRALQCILQQYSRLFEELRGLPPSRYHDHQIPLKDENHVVKIRPYRYSSVQKIEIEKLVDEMKTIGISRDNTSFSHLLWS